MVLTLENKQYRSCDYYICIISYSRLSCFGLGGLTSTYIWSEPWKKSSKYPPQENIKNPVHCVWCFWTALTLRPSLLLSWNENPRTTSLGRGKSSYMSSIGKSKESNIDLIFLKLLYFWVCPDSSSNQHDPFRNKTTQKSPQSLSSHARSGSNSSPKNRRRFVKGVTKGGRCVSLEFEMFVSCSTKQLT